MGKVEDVGAKLASSYGELVSANVVPGVVKGSKYYVIEYKQPAGRAMVKTDAKQGRTYTLAVTTPASASAELIAEADALTASFKCFPVNAICISQSNSGSTPVGGSCY